MSALVPWSHELELVSDPLSVGDARRFVSEVLTEHNLPSLVGDVELVVSELATNALLHAGTSFTVRLRTALGRAVVLLGVSHFPAGVVIVGTPGAERHCRY